MDTIIQWRPFTNPIIVQWRPFTNPTIDGDWFFYVMEEVIGVECSPTEHILKIRSY